MSTLPVGTPCFLGASVLWLSLSLAFASLAFPGFASAKPGEAAPKDTRVDLLTFAAGAIPLEVRGPATDIGAGFEQAVGAIDGGVSSFTLSRKFASDDTWVEFVYVLPALTTFDRFAVPEVHETPSPNQTFTRRIEVMGSPTSPSKGMQTLAVATLSVHERRGQMTELEIKKRIPVRYLVVRLTGGIEAGAKFFEFSELIGNGTQEAVPMAKHFTGTWRPRAGLMGLNQEGAVVSGCLDKGRKTLTGTVSGNILRATFIDNSSGTSGALIASVNADGVLFGLRSDNGAPFRVYTGPRVPGAASPCPTTPKPRIGCGSTVHGIQFAFDSAKILPRSEDILQRLYDGLNDDPATRVTIEGHTSSEGSESYNLSLSKRRATAVVDDLRRRGIAASRLVAVGLGESQPIAREDTEAGRALNRRVEIDCATE